MPQAIGTGIALVAAKVFAFKTTSFAFAVWQFAGSTAATFLIAHLLRRHKKDDGANLETQQSPAQADHTVRQPLSPQRIIFGRPKVFGSLVFSEVSGEGVEIDENALENESALKVGSYLVETTIFCNHKTHGIDSIDVGNVRNIGLAAGAATTAPFQLDGRSYLQIEELAGEADQGTPAVISRNFPNLPNLQHHRYRGFSGLVGEYHYGESQERNSDLWGGGRDLRARVRGVACWDPTDSNQDPADPSTWLPTDNPALIIAFLLQHQKFLPSGITYADIDRGWLEWSTRVCRQAVPRLNDDFNDTENFGKVMGTERRYTADGVIDLNESQLDVIQNLLVCMHGALTFDGSKHIIKAGWHEPLADPITDDILVGDVQFVHGTAASENFSQISVRATVPEINYLEAALPLIRLKDVTGEEPDRPFGEATLTLPYTLGSSRGQRMGQLALKQTRLQKSLSVNVNSEGLKYLPTDKVPFSSERFPFANGLWDIATITPNEQFNGFELALTEWDPVYLFGFDPKSLKPFDPRGQTEE